LTWSGVGILQAYGQDGVLLEEVRTELLDLNLDEATATISRGSADISHVLLLEEHTAGATGIRVRRIGFNSVPEASVMLMLGAGLLAVVSWSLIGSRSCRVRV
jgi:hypothetical protein